MSTTPAAAAAEFDGLRLLLVEDHPVNREVVLALLEPTNIEIDIAVDGREAVTKAASGAYDLILMDVQMPVMDGLAATREIRRLPAHASTPIIAMTADAFAEDRTRCLEAGMSDYVAKPFEPAHLTALIHKWTSRPAPQTAAPTPDALAGDAAGANDDGIDFEHGNLISHGKPERYLDLLKDFVQESANDIARMRAEVRSLAMADARRTSHSLKGAAALMGATRMQSLVQNFEDKLAAHANPAALDAVIDEIESARCAIERHLDARRARNQAQPSPVVDEAQALSTLSVLAELLIEGDIRSNRVMADSAALIEAYLGQWAKVLARQIDNFDYEAATDTLRKALQERRR